MHCCYPAVDHQCIDAASRPHPHHTYIFTRTEPMHDLCILLFFTCMFHSSMSERPSPRTSGGHDTFCLWLAMCQRTPNPHSLVIDSSSKAFVKSCGRLLGAKSHTLMLVPLRMCVRNCMSTIWQKSLKVIGCAVRTTEPPGVWAMGPLVAGSAPAEAHPYYCYCHRNIVPIAKVSPPERTVGSQHLSWGPGVT
jgi:hypothetical protein